MVMARVMAAWVREKGDIDYVWEERRVEPWRIRWKLSGLIALQGKGAELDLLLKLMAIRSTMNGIPLRILTMPGRLENVTYKMPSLRTRRLGPARMCNLPSVALMRRDLRTGTNFQRITFSTGGRKVAGWSFELCHEGGGEKGHFQ